MKLAFPRLYVDTSAIAGVLDWYCQRLGMEIMNEMRNDKELIHWVGFKSQPQSSIVEFRSLLQQANPPRKYTAKPSSDVYWKIGLSLADVDTARSKLVGRGVQVTSPRQFLEIGYLCHLSDPFGYTIELLQHDFQSNFNSGCVSLQPNLVLGQHCHIGQITLRVADIDESLKFYESKLGMKYLSRQSIPNMFNLFFLGCTDEKPPSEDVNAVEIREWLWKRPYTTLELQHWPDENKKYKTADLNHESGFTALVFKVDSQYFEELKASPWCRSCYCKVPRIQHWCVGV